MRKHIPTFLTGIRILVIILVSASCSKKVNTYNIPDDFQSWCRYKVGTYWIYRNEKTLLTDCTYVKIFSVETHNQEGDNYKVIAYYDVESSDISGSFLSSFRTEAHSGDYASMSINLKYGDIEFSTDLVTNPHYTKAWYEGQSSGGVVPVFPKEEINGNSFSNVYLCRTESQTWEGDSVIVDGHLVRTIGLVEYKHRVDKVDTTWTLVRWHVIQ